MKYCFLLTLLLVTRFLAASEKVELQGKELIEQAEAKTNIFELPSFEMKASLRIDNNGKPLDGSYLFLWNGPERWREEINFQGYNEVRVGAKGVVFLKRNTDFTPLQISRLHSTLGHGSGRQGSFINLAPGPKETVKKIQDRKVNGIRAQCAEIADHENRSREVCVDASTGALVRQDPFVDREMMPIGEKLFPRFLSYVENGKPLAEVRIAELTATNPLPASAFEPPSGAVSKPGCMNPIPGRLVKRVQPEYPPAQRQLHVEGTVLMYALITQDGVPQELRVVSSVNPMLDKASLDAVRQWRYEPATCNGTAVEVETVITVNYSLMR